MLKLITSFRELPVTDIIRVYAQSIDICSKENYPNMPTGQQQLLAEQDFITYLRNDFFPNGGIYALWQIGGRCVAAMRLVPYRDALLLAGLETEPQCRNKGYATALIGAAFSSLAEKNPITVYSHIDKKNDISLAVHKKCGFKRNLEYGVFIDGSVSYSFCTMKCDIGGSSLT